MIAGDNTTVLELSERARTDRIATGHVEADGVALRTGGSVGIGDTVVTRRNNRTLKTGPSDFVKNGDLWDVTNRSTDGSLTVRNSRHGGTLTLPAEYVAHHVELGYAATVHRAQGITVDTSRTLVDATSTTREQLYVAMTRGHVANHAYAITDTLDPIGLDHQPQAATTVRDVLASVLDRTDETGRSAHETIQSAYEHAESLQRLVPEYEHALGLAHAQRIDAAVQQVLGQDHHLPGMQQPGVQELRDDPAYPALRARLATRAEAGHDPVAVLGQVVDRRELATATSPAATLCWRLDQTPPAGTRQHPGERRDLSKAPAGASAGPPTVANESQSGKTN